MDSLPNNNLDSSTSSLDIESTTRENEGLDNHSGPLLYMLAHLQRSADFIRNSWAEYTGLRTVTGFAGKEFCCLNVSTTDRRLIFKKCTNFACLA